MYKINKSKIYGKESYIKRFIIYICIHGQRHVCVCKGQVIRKQKFRHGGKGKSKSKFAQNQP